MSDDAFKSFDLLAQRRLSHAKLGGRPSEMQGLGDGNEIPEMSQFNLPFHIFIVSISMIQILDISSQLIIT